MKKEEPIRPSTRYYKLGALERAIVRLKGHVARPMDQMPLHFMPTELMMLLEAARLGAAEFYQNPELLDKLNYPFP